MKIKVALTQITATADQLYGLDKDGRVWSYKPASLSLNYPRKALWSQLTAHGSQYIPDEEPDNPDLAAPPEEVGPQQCDKCGEKFPGQIPAHRCSDPITWTPTGDQDLGEQVIHPMDKRAREFLAAHTESNKEHEG